MAYCRESSRRQQATVHGGRLRGPRVIGARGRPRPEPFRGRLADTATAARLWDISAELTGVAPDLG
jgi:hypothetical protein